MQLHRIFYTLYFIGDEVKTARFCFELNALLAPHVASSKIYLANDIIVGIVSVRNYFKFYS